MKKISTVSALALFVSGCLSSAPDAPVLWTIEPDPPASFAPGGSSSPDAKILSVDVRAPYNGTHLAVIRPDGSLAFDPFNVFAANPAFLLKSAALDVISASGVFRRVLPAASSARAEITLELTVTRLALDCTDETQKHALVALTLTAVSDRKIAAVSGAQARVPVSGSGGFSKPFTKAFEEAMAKAVKSLATQL